jgi:virulence-associated protein VagC
VTGFGRSRGLRHNAFVWSILRVADIPREWFSGADGVEIRRQNGAVLIVPVRREAPIHLLGRQPVDDELMDASTNLDQHLYRGEYIAEIEDRRT